MSNRSVLLGNRQKIALFYGISFLFILLQAFFLVRKDTLLAAALPAVLLVVLLAFYQLDRLLLLITFLTPISVPLSELFPQLPFDMFLPTEPMLFGVLILFFFKLIELRKIDRDITRHPVSLAIYFYLAWMLFTSITSTMPVVSLKFWLSKLWFIAAFYFFGIYLFRDFKNIYRFVGLYSAAFIVVIFYAWSRHVGYGFHNDNAAHFVMNPFYKDHTSYGAMLAFFIPFLIGLTFSKQIRSNYRWLAFVGLMFFAVALVLSYSRAAWLSLAGALGIWLIFKLKIRFRPLFISVLSAIAIVVLFQSQILMFLERNDQESSANLANHLSSMTNISSDASNLERLNRWNCAIRMFEEKPIVGWGPGTYMFQYAPYQLTRLRTIISTNSADRGNAHSEYLGALTESGMLGLVSFLLLLIVVYYVAVHTYTRTSSSEIKLIILSAIIGLSTYFMHGFLNNFLDTDKAAIPFWGFVAIIVMLDIYTRKEEVQLRKNP